jgi:hypothetical protein
MTAPLGLFVGLYILLLITYFARALQIDPGASIVAGKTPYAEFFESNSSASAVS